MAPRSLRTITTATVPVAVGGLVLAITTGAGLFATQATEYFGNPFLFIKFSAIAVGVANAAAVRALPEWQERGDRDLLPGERRRLAVVGGISLASWISAIAAGRLIAYGDHGPAEAGHYTFRTDAGLTPDTTDAFRGEGRSGR